MSQKVMACFNMKGLYGFLYFYTVNFLFSECTVGQNALLLDKIYN